MPFDAFIRLAFALLVATAAPAAWTAEPDAAVNRPQVVTQVKPDYPMAVKRANIEGAVVARLRVDAEGNVRAVSIRRSPHELLSDAVEEALRKWKFRPFVKDGQPSGFTVQYQIDFRLHDEEPYVGAYGAPPPSPEEASKYIAAKEGVESLRGDYWSAAIHKAFASSDDGAWAAMYGYSTVERAAEAAREACERHRARAHRRCKLVNVDGEWQAGASRGPTPLRLLPEHEIVTIRQETLESWPDDRKLRVVPFLAQCREAADGFMETWKTNDTRALYGLVAEELRDQYSPSEFAEGLAAIRKAVGAVASPAFHQQDLVVAKRDEESLAELHSRVVYTALSPARQNSGIVLVLLMSRESGSCRVASFAYVLLSDGRPPWLRGGEQPPRGT